ncbi:sialin-like [Penaeus japonicus]|uniref:sialin-like n=1 Tax=Penaeus japonicus TaxID=27405 RepID=UPI001C713978|nr:sialin-like [Penaeus japonicus]XP_042869420.1 sialin-like [Penaeus japonicus]
MVPRKTIARVHDLVHRENELGENNKRLEGSIGEGREVSENVGTCGTWMEWHTLSLLAWTIMAILTATRVSLSIVIVAMVEGQPQTNTSRVPGRHSDQHIQGTPLGGRFPWDEHTQGQILGACYYGYALSNPVGGRLAEVIGGKWVVGMGALLTAMLTFLAPLCAGIATNLFLTLLVLRGVTEGVCFPALTSLLAARVPHSKRAKVTSFVYGGFQMGIAVSLVLSGWLCDNHALGWPSTFYCFGGCGVLVAGFWFLLLQEDEEPSVATHPRGPGSPRAHGTSIHALSGTRHDTRNSVEVVDVTASLPYEKNVDTTPKAEFPWRSVLTSVPVWSLSAMHIGSNWGLYTFLTVVPSFLSNILHFDMNSNGLVSALPSLCMLVFNLVYSSVVSTVSKSGRITTVTVRRVSTLFGAGGPMLCLVGLCFVGYRKDLIVMLLCMAMGFKGAMYLGYMCSHQDLTPTYAGTLFGITNCLATIPGFLAPSIVSIITHGNQTLSAWQSVFLLTAGVYLVSGTIYVLGISVEVQPWNDPQNIKEDEKPDTGTEKTRF